MTNITDAEIVSETNSLLQRATKVSNFKARGEDLLKNKASEKINGAVNNSTASNNSTNSGSKKVSEKWLFNKSDFAEQVIKNDEDDDEIDQRAVEDKEIVSEADRQASAETVTGLIDLGMTTVFGGYELYKFKKSFTPVEWKRLKEVRGKKRADLSDDDKLFFDKIVRRTAKYKERQKEVEMTPDEEKKTKRGMFSYYTAANKKVSPEFLFYSTLLVVIGGRFTDSLLDEGYE